MATEAPARELAGPQHRRPAIRLAISLGAVLVLLAGYLLLPQSRTAVRAFSASGVVNLGADGCALVRVDGRMSADATRDLGPLTRWSNIRLVDSTVRASLHKLGGEGSCTAGSPVLVAAAFGISQRWNGADPRITRFEQGTEFTSTISTGPVEFPGRRRGSEICVSGVVGLDLGSDDETHALDVAACLP